jgi:hypothetical protein
LTGALAVIPLHTLKTEEIPMTEIELAELGLDRAKTPLSRHSKEFTEAEYYKVVFLPTFPLIEEFKPNKYVYASLTENSISVLGTHDSANDFYQLSIVMPRDVKNGRYDVVESGNGGVSCTVIAGNIGYSGRNGTVTIEQDKTRQSIKATFDYEFLYKRQIYRVESGKLFLLATGPL